MISRRTKLLVIGGAATAVVLAGMAGMADATGSSAPLPQHPKRTLASRLDRVAPR